MKATSPAIITAFHQPTRVASWRPRCTTTSAMTITRLVADCHSDSGATSSTAQAR
jgi:hypothetical protein